MNNVQCVADFVTILCLVYSTLTLAVYFDVFTMAELLVCWNFVCAGRVWVNNSETDFRVPDSGYYKFVLESYRMYSYLNWTRQIVGSLLKVENNKYSWWLWLKAHKYKLSIEKAIFTKNR